MSKYLPFERMIEKISLKNRTWPDCTISKAPVWCSVDLRDGNQALSKPMSIEEKLIFFDMLVKIGFKEIEVGFPSASQTEFDFLRRLIEGKRIPPDVTIQVLSQAREHLIERTFQAIDGAASVIFHIYNSTSPAQRKYTFNMEKHEIVKIAVDGVESIKNKIDSCTCPNFMLEYSPESFSATEIDFSIEICEEVKRAWNFCRGEKIILNLPTTVECSLSNVYADQIEYFGRHITEREKVILSLHNHNDRGCAVATCELGLLAGADRVEGTLFGNGERTGNLDIMTVALNMLSAGIEPQLDFSHLSDIAEQYSSLTNMPIHPRHPYAGDLVFTAFSGSHQDAIRKGLSARNKKIKTDGENALWDIPYLPLDPHDIGREYEAIIRINSQSGKGGSAWILENEHGIYLPKGMQSVFGALVTAKSDELQRELDSQEIFTIFTEQWLNKTSPLVILDIAETHLTGDNVGSPQVALRASVCFKGKTIAIGGRGNGPLNAFIAALRESNVKTITVTSFHEHSIGSGSDTDAIAYVEITDESGKRFWGAGRSSNIGRAGIYAVVSAVNQAD